MPWGDLPERGAGGAVIAQCAKGRRQDMNGVLTKTLDPQSFLDMFNDYAALVEAYPLANSSAVLLEQFAQQGIDQYPDDFNAFPHRGTFNNFVEIVGQWDDDSVAEATNAWTKKWRDHFAQPEISGYDHMVIYQNYAHGDEPLSALYGREAWRQERLTALKTSYDPYGFFDAYHAIPRDVTQWT
jgi:fumiquinazoline A oxidase